jgi:hypothetical protein
MGLWDVDDGRVYPSADGVNVLLALLDMDAKLSPNPWKGFRFVNQFAELCQ